MAKQKSKKGMPSPNSRKTDLLLLLTIVVIAISVYLFFKTLFGLQLGMLTLEIMAAMLGAILTVMITMLLIRQQGTVQRAHEAAAVNATKIFEKKLELFNRFLMLYSGAAKDGVLERNELVAMKELALTISLFTKPVTVGVGATTAPNATKLAPMTKDLGEELCRYVFQLQKYGKFYVHMSDEEKSEVKKYFNGYGCEGQSIVDILRLMKTELDVAQMSGENETDQTWTTKLMEFHINGEAN